MSPSGAHALRIAGVHVRDADNLTGEGPDVAPPGDLFHIRFCYTIPFSFTFLNPFLYFVYFLFTWFLQEFFATTPLVYSYICMYVCMYVYT